MTQAIIFSATSLYLLPVALFIGYGIFSKQRKEFWILSFFVLPISYLFGVLANHLIFDPRPFVVSNVIPLFPHIPDNGFPSDHALLTGTLAAIMLPFDGWLAALLWVLAFIIGAARVLAHIHHTIDILGSFFIALASFAAVQNALRRLRAKTLPPKREEK